MVYDLTGGAVAAHSGARVHTLVVDAGAVARTVGTDDALGSAAGGHGRTREPGDALTHCHSVRDTAHSVGAAW